MADEDKQPDVDETPSEEFAHSDRIPVDERPTPPEPELEAEPEAETAITPEPEPEAVPGAPTEVTETKVSGPDERPEPAARSPLVPILAAATAVCFVAAVLFGLMAFAPRLAPIKSGPAKLAVKAQDEQAAVELATVFAKNFLSIDYRTIDADFARLVADATGTLKDGLQRTLNAVGDAFRKQKTSTESKVRDSLLLSSDGDTVRVQVLLDRTKRNVATKGKPITEQRVVNVTVVKTADGWKASRLQEVTPEALIDSRSDAGG